MADFSADLSVALDVPSVDHARALVKELSGLPVVYKIGLELFTVAGASFVQSLAESGNRVFLDLKLHDIPTTVARALDRIDEMRVEFTTLHLSGGEKMLNAIDPDLQVKILGVSVLTSFSEAEWKEAILPITPEGEKIRTVVLNYAELANHHPRVHGMVCSPFEASSVRKAYPQLYLLTPGIRPDGSVAHDQARVMTPKQAVAAGSSMIVVGRPITAAPSPRAVAEAILKEIQT